MRRQSFHTRAKVERLNQDSKGNISKLEIQTTGVLDTKQITETAPSNKSLCCARKPGKSVTFVTLINKELLNCQDKLGNYNGLINILKKPEFLVACYEEIRGKPGNMMTPGMIETTLVGLT